MKTSVFSALVLATSMSVMAATEIQETQRYTDAATRVTILGGSVDLPFEGYWILPIPHSSSGSLRECRLVPPPAVLQALQGQRQGRMEEHRAVRRSSQPLRNLYWSCFEYAREHDGAAPASIDVLDQNRRPLPEIDGQDRRIHYIPGIQLLTDPKDRNSRPGHATILAFETRPVIDDGKHWIVLSDGRTERRAVDPDLFARHGATLVPGKKPLDDTAQQRPERVTYQVVARVGDSASGVDTFVASNRITGATRDLTWDTTHSMPGDSGLMQTWAQSRLGELAYLGRQANTSVIQHWLARASALYHLDGNAFSWVTNPRDNRRRNRQATLFGVLGGRAAIRETLQLQNLVQTDGDDSATSPISIDTVPGVEVTSHPFAEMLAGSPGGALELARVVPPDRLFAYFAKPKGMLQLLDGGTEFMFNAGSMMTQRSVTYRLQDRYFSRLGFSASWARAFLNGGAVKELAVVVPDLFLIDGTDITVVARLKNPLLASAALAVLGMGDLSDRSLVHNTENEPVSWAKRDDLLFISTDEGELDRMLALQAVRGIGSLGTSPEFRYMLTQLPVEEDTTTLVYFSDPFIRRLVGPHTKIAQLRRIQARAELETLTAATLLYRADGHSGPLDLQDLIQRGYASPLSHVLDARLESDGVAVSDRFGQPSRMHNLSAAPVTQVTPAEARAYTTYRDNYTRYWRRFFDPIAIRVNQPTEREFELSTFILPLVDNSIYQGLRRALNPMESGLPLVVPTLDPAPVAMLSFNVHEEAWLESLDEMSEMVTRMFGLNGRILDALGPDVHVAVMDDDPIISFGSGDLAGSFGGMFGGGDADEMLLLPLLGSVLTRPTHILIGVNDPDAVLQFLRTTPLPSSYEMRDDWMEAGMYRQAAKDRWIYRLSLAGMVHLRFGIEVQDRYLVISNLPLTTSTAISPGRVARHSGAQLLLHPQACEQQLASLFASAHENQRAAALEGIGHLLPLLLAGAPSVDAARADHQRLFGFAPIHPPGGQWTWNGFRLASTMYGDMAWQEQPVYPPGARSFGMLRGVDQLRLSMQLEQDGLRTTARWTLREQQSESVTPTP